MKKFSGFIVEKKFLVLIIASLLLLLSVFTMATTKIEYDLETYLPNLDSVDGIKVLDEELGMASMGILQIKNMESHDVIKLKEKISKVQGVDKALCISDILGLGVPKEILPEEINKVFYNNNSTVMLIKFTDTAFSSTTSKAISEIRKITDKQCMLGGVAAISKDIKDLGMKDIKVVGIVAGILLILVLALTMHSILVPIIMFLASIFALVFNMGTNFMFGDVSIATIPLVALLQIGVTFNFSIFLYHRYMEGKENLETKEEAMTFALEKITKVIVGCALATISIALALIAMNVGLTTNVAIVFTKGIVFSLIATVTVLPVLLLLLDKPISAVSYKPLLPSFNGTSNFVINNRKWLMVSFLCILVLAFIGKQNVKVSYDMLAALPKDMESVVATNKLKKDLDMPISHFIIVNKTVESYKLAEMSNKVAELDGITLVMGDDKLMGSMIPQDFIPEEISKIYSTDKQKLILANSSYTPGTKALNTQIEKMTKIVKTFDKDAMITGEGIIGKDVADITEKGFIDMKFVAIITILIVFALIYRSILTPFILILTLELVTFTNTSILFYTGQKIPFMISTVLGLIQLGITVSYVMLITSRFKEELSNGNNKVEAMKLAIRSTSKSVVVSALPLLIATVGAAIATNISIVSTICLLVASGALISMVAVIVLLPAVLIGSEEFISKTSLLWTKRTVNNTNISEGR